MGSRTKTQNETDRQATVEEALGGVDDTPRSLVLTSADAAAEEALLDTLQGQSHALQVIEQRVQILSNMRMAAVRLTEPEQWVVNRDLDGREIAYPGSAACNRLAEVYGIEVFNIGPRGASGTWDPQVYTHEDGVVELRAHASVRCAATKRHIELVEFSRRSDERFIGRGDHKKGIKHEADLRSSVLSGLHASCIRRIVGTSRVPLDYCASVWNLGIDVVRERINRGHGYGSSTERRASAVAEEGADKLAAALWRDILQATEGDQEAAKGVLRDITTFTGRDGNTVPGITDWKRLTKVARVNMCRKAFREHRVFGAAVGDGTPGEARG